MGCALKTPTQNTLINTNIMTKDLYISLLSKGNNGNELLSILDSFVSDEEQPTVQSNDLEFIQF